ncbi:MAG: hypothetical protein C4527_16070 [Candidatus Omnitrophota bacterium]|jgi:hypothetical protein|nr:MAG: hypothetical protein C4527_16070 [Candidatus Omnitrophota bacterium]
MADQKGTMNNQFSDSNIQGDGDFYLDLRHLCILDCKTEVGTISLILDQKQPHYLFVSIDEELRKCYSLLEFQMQFDNEKQVIEFLIQLVNSDFMDDLIAIEKNLDEGWAAL